MRRTLLGIALVSGFMFMASSAFANPALLKKHDGYPDETGKATTSTGEAAALKAAENAPKALKGQVKAAEEDTRAGLANTGDPRETTHPGYPDRGVKENMIKDATKVIAAPK